MCRITSCVIFAGMGESAARKRARCVCVIISIVHRNKQWRELISPGEGPGKSEKGN